MRLAAPVRIIVPILSLLVLAALLAACAGRDDTSSTTSATANPVGDTLDPSDPLAYVSFGLPASAQCVAVGQRFAVELGADPSEGRQWRVTAPTVGPVSTSVLVLGGTEFVGGAGTDEEVQRLTFAAASLGEADLTVTYVGADGAAVPDVAEETWPIIVTTDGTCPPPPEVTETTIAEDDD